MALKYYILLLFYLSSVERWTVFASAWDVGNTTVKKKLNGNKQIFFFLITKHVTDIDMVRSWCSECYKFSWIQGISQVIFSSVYFFMIPMSWPTSGFRPLYTLSAFSLSPWKRTVENSVLTKPGFIWLTLMGVSTSS